MDYVRERSRTGLKSTFTENQDRVIRRLRDEGVTFAKIADQLGRSEDSVKHRFYALTGRKYYGKGYIRIGSRNDRLTDDEKLQITKLRQAGHTCPQIALSIGRSKDAVSRFCKMNYVSSEASHEARTRRHYADLQPLYEAPVKVDDEDHVAMLRRLGGFTRENQWSGARISTGGSNLSTHQSVHSL